MADASDRNRLITCRACGNRVPRTARRCPACGTRDPARPAPVTAVPRPSTRRASRRGRRLLVVVLALVVVASAGVITATLVWGPPPAPLPLERRPETPLLAPAPPAGRAPVPSRSRGRTDWLFFFKAGDRLARMGEDTPLGEIVRTENVHAFPDGSSGPAYIVRAPDGEERALDADELERGARVQ
ncbi:MAG TPA: hypothetical protein VFL90_06670 [Methylomirabilota bacterium]|nr:hypothetical protein [Methylomirabilota bacterium]